jgi:hypothetical protein
MKVYLIIFFISALEGGIWLASRSGHFILSERVPSTYYIESSLLHRAGIHVVDNIKAAYTCRALNPPPLLERRAALRSGKESNARIKWSK